FGRITEIGVGFLGPLGRLSLHLSLVRSTADQGQFVNHSTPIGERFGDFNSLLTSLVRDQVPNPAAAGNRKQSEFTVAGLSLKEMRQRVCVVTSQPIRFASKAHADRRFLAAQKIEYPTTLDVLSWPAAVAQDVSVGTAGPFQGVRKSRQPVKS